MVFFALSTQEMAALVRARVQAEDIFFSAARRAVGPKLDAYLRRTTELHLAKELQQGQLASMNAKRRRLSHALARSVLSRQLECDPVQRQQRREVLEATGVLSGQEQEETRMMQREMMMNRLEGLLRRAEGLNVSGSAAALSAAQWQQQQQQHMGEKLVGPGRRAPVAVRRESMREMEAKLGRSRLYRYLLILVLRFFLG